MVSQAGAFRDQADRIATWDAKLRKSRLNLHKLIADVDELQNVQTRLDDDLGNVESRQKDMERTLSQLEGYMATLLDRRPKAQASEDALRMRAEAYIAARELDSLINQLDNNLREIERKVDHVEQNQSADVSAQVRAVIDEQMRNLVQVQTGSRIVAEQAKDITARAEKTMASLN